MREFDVWAPRARSVDLHLDGRVLPMTCTGEWWSVAAEGSDYGFSLDHGPVRPDPRSRWQPNGVHGLSRVVEDLDWTDQGWRGTPLKGAVLYELHVGTFTSGGTFDSALERLPHLVDLGVTAVELMPCNAFDGRWGWGYDGVAWYAVHEPYGGPQGLARFVDACHAVGLGVVMDVVYNHLGPAGNYLPELGPYLTTDVATPWGGAVDLRQPEVRRYVLDNAAMWLRDYHLDGLRLDAVHALLDLSVLGELKEQTAALSRELGRDLWVVAESDLNDASLLDHVDGLWDDDVHHALHATLTGERQGYYVDFGPLDVLAKALRGAYVHDGTWSTFRGRPHGAPVEPDVPGHRFVVCQQNHDQVGNRALGDRPVLSTRLRNIGAAVLLLSPYTPMLFMGEEYGATTPWLFFTDHDGELGDAVRKGRREEFASHGWVAEEVPDPQRPETFAASVLDWDVDEPTLRLYRELIRLRRRWLVDDDRRSLDVQHGEGWLVMRRGPIVVQLCFVDQEPLEGEELLAVEGVRVSAVQQDQ